MNGKEYIEKINNLNNCIKAFEASLSINDGSLLTLTDSQQKEIKDYLEDYKYILLNYMYLYPSDTH